jgi:ribosomal protein S18 acetylase RimI-like enzyme
MDILIRRLTPELVNDFLFFFDNIVFTENPHWSACYCYSFHFTGPDDQWKREENRSAVINLITEDKMSGYLAYSDNKPVGWCNANNRNNYQRLLKYYDLVDNPADVACSLVCFLISPEWRRNGISEKLVEQIYADYSMLGYDYIEAYPGKGKLSSEGHYKGPLSLYEKLNFKIVKEYEKYYVVRKMII